MRTNRHATCKHFNGMANKVCEAGVEYQSVLVRPLRLPCLHNDLDCDKRQWKSAEEIEAEEKEFERLQELIQAGKSPCCEAPIDESRVITTGRHEGHGPRYCSKCKKLVYLV